MMGAMELPIETGKEVVMTARQLSRGMTGAAVIAVAVAIWVTAIFTVVAFWAAVAWAFGHGIPAALAPINAHQGLVVLGAICTTAYIILTTVAVIRLSLK